MFIDVHAHLNDDKYSNNLQEVLSKAKQNNVGVIICSGYDEKSSKSALNLASRFENVYCTIGMHPHDAKYYNDEFENVIKDLASNRKVLAIGEIGLDYHYDLSPRDIQRQVFEKQIVLAHELQLPIVIHTREAIKDTIDILNKNKNLLKQGFLFHCYNASKEITTKLLNENCYFSFGGTSTFKNATNIREVIELIPIGKILLETDCPYLTPHPFRGEINEPYYIPLIAEKIAEIKGVSLKEVEQITTNNAKRFFKF